MASQESEKYEAIRKKVLEQQKIEREKEIARFSKGHYKNFKESDRKSRLEFYKFVMTTYLSDLGFSLDKTLSTKKLPIIAKDFMYGWKIGFYLILDSFLQHYSMDTDSGFLDLHFGLIHESNKAMKSSDRNKYVFFSFKRLFPIARFRFAQAYSEFHNLQELEVLLLAHIDMYSIIQDQFCELAKEALNKAKELKVGVFREEFRDSS